MPEEMRVEAMELCVTACEKYATNNEVLAKSRNGQASVTAAWGTCRSGPRGVGQSGTDPDIPFLSFGTEQGQKVAKSLARSQIRFPLSARSVVVLCFHAGSRD